MRKTLRAFSYIEVLVAMVIISGVFTAFINMAYSAVHRAKILEQRDLMENYAYALLEKFGDALAATSDIWTSGHNRYSIIIQQNTNGDSKEVLTMTPCNLTTDGHFLKNRCAMVNDVLNKASNKFGYFFQVSPISYGKVIKVTLVLGCVQYDKRKTCRGEELAPVKIVKYFTNYGQEK